MANAGIDYGLGQSNIDMKTGIRYGVISQHSMADWFFDEFEADYGEPTCPKCGDSVADTSGHGDDEYEQYGHGCADYVCHSCKHTLDSSDVFRNDPIGHHIDNGEVVAVDCLDTDVMIIKSPFYTFAPFCSPCVPGAGNLDDAREGGVKTYCFGHDWFDGGKAPYPVYRVADDTLVTE